MYREIFYDERDYEDGATPGQEIVTFDDLDDGEDEGPFIYREAYRKEVPPQNTH